MVPDIIIIIFALMLVMFLYVLHRLKRLRSRYQTLLENAGDAVVIINKKGKLVHVSTSIHKVLGYTVKEALNLDILSIAHPDDIGALQLVMERVMVQPGVPVIGHKGRMLHGDGTWHWYEAVVTNMLHDPNIKGIVDNFRDVTTSVLAEEKINNANRLYAFTSQINQVIVQTRTDREVFIETCRIATEYGQFKMAWVGLFNADKSMVTLSESKGIGKEYLASFKNAEVNEKGPMYQVVKTGRPFVCNDIDELKLPSWRIFADVNAIKSFMILPITRSGELIGTLNLYSSQPNLFDEKEYRLLKEVADNISFALDIFEKERLREVAEKKHRHSELRLKQAQSIAHVGSFEIDFTTGVSTWSEELCKIYGLDLCDNNHPYDGWLEMVHPDDLPNVMSTINEVKASFESSAIYHRIIRKDGKIRHVYSQGEYEFDAQGKVTGLHGVAHDITEIKESEGARTQSEKNLQLIMDLIPQGIFVKDMQGKFLFVNNSFAKLSGESPEQFLQNPKHQGVEHNKNRHKFLEEDQHVITTGISLTIPELKLVDEDGSTKYFQTLKVPYTLSGDTARSMLGIYLDITDQKNAETERINIIADLMDRNKDLEQFSYVVSHNVRAPLANIMSLISLLNPETTGKDGSDILSALTISTSKLDAVISDLNFILNIKNGSTEAKQQVNLNELFADIKIGITNLIVDCNVTLTSDFSKLDHIYCFKTYLHSIFHNLILNSIKYRKTNVATVIKVSSRAEKGKLILEFEDNGMGIDLERYHEELFGLYKRFHLHIEGKGMGLYMVKMQVEQLKGNITVNSKLDVGTKFTIEFKA